jgi:hypothetical protein
VPQGHDPHHICPAHEAPRPAAGFDAVPRQPVIGAAAEPEAHCGRYECRTGEGRAEPPTNLRIGGTGDGEQQPDTQRQCPPDEPQVRRLQPHPPALAEGAHGQPVINTCHAQFLGVARRRSPPRADHPEPYADACGNEHQSNHDSGASHPNDEGLHRAQRRGATFRPEQSRSLQPELPAGGDGFVGTGSCAARADSRPVGRTGNGWNELPIPRVPCSKATDRQRAVLGIIPCSHTRAVLILPARPLIEHQAMHVFRLDTEATHLCGLYRICRCAGVVLLRLLTCPDAVGGAAAVHAHGG